MSSRIPQDFIDQLLTQVDIIDLIDSYVPLRKKGGSYTACCPFHSEKTPSFHVSATKQLYHCFGCDVGGNAIHFLMTYEKLDFLETIKRLAQRVGVDLPQTSFANQEKPIQASLYPLLEEVTVYFQQELKRHPEAIDYLKNRGVSGQIAKTFRVGYASDQWDKLYKTFSQKYTLEDLLNAGLVVKREHGGFYDRFRDRIMFPIRDLQGRVIGFGGRILGKGEPKYLNSPETPLFQKGKELYGLYEARQATHNLDAIWIVEGYMDLIALAQADISNVAATLGTAVTTTHLQRLLRFTQEIIFCFDGDEAGRKAAWRALETLLPLMQDGCQIRFVLLSEGEDPDTYVRNVGRENFLATAAQTMPEFFFNTLLKEIDLHSPEGRAKLAKQASEYIKKIPGQFLQKILLERLSHVARIEMDNSVKRLSIKNMDQRNYFPSRDRRQTRKKPFSPVRLVIMLILQYPHLAAEIQFPEEIEKLTIPGIDILKELYILLKSNPHLKTRVLIEHWRGREGESAIQKLATQSHWIPENGVMQELQGALLQLKALCLEYEIDALFHQGQMRALTENEKTLLQALIRDKKRS
jgi:DNA primase